MLIRRFLCAAGIHDADGSVGLHRHRSRRTGSAGRRRRNRADRRLFAGAAQACSAAFEGRTELWPLAESAWEQAGGPESVHCLNVPVYDLLDQLVRAHRADPEATFEVGGNDGQGRLIVLPDNDSIRLEFGG